MRKCTGQRLRRRITRPSIRGAAGVCSPSRATAFLRPNAPLHAPVRRAQPASPRTIPHGACPCMSLTPRAPQPIPGQVADFPLPDAFTKQKHRVVPPLAHSHAPQGVTCLVSHGLVPVTGCHPTALPTKGLSTMIVAHADHRAIPAEIPGNSHKFVGRNDRRSGQNHRETELTNSRIIADENTPSPPPVDAAPDLGLN